MSILADCMRGCTAFCERPMVDYIGQGSLYEKLWRRPASRWLTARSAVKTQLILNEHGVVYWPWY